MSLRVFAWFIFLAIAIDHKSIPQTEWLVAIAVIFFGVGCVGFLVRDTTSFESSELRWLAGIWLPLFVSIVPLIFGSLSISGFLITSQPYILAGFGFLVALIFHKRNQLDWFMENLAYVCLVSMFFTFFIGYLKSDGDVVSARYAIISFSTLMAVPFFLLSFYFGKRSFVSIFVLTSVLVLALASTTRSFLLAYILTFLFASLVIFYRINERSIFLPRFASALLLLFIAFIGFFFLNPIFFENWLLRLTSASQVGFDVTSYTRLAEIDGQLNLLFSDFFNSIFGLGLGGKYFWSSEYDMYLLASVGYEDLIRDYDYVGHNFWIYSLFANGLLFGWIFPSVVLFCFFRSFHAVRKTSNAVDRRDYSYKFIAFCGLLFFLLMTVGGNVMGLRTGGFLVGFLIALSVL